ncbi:MAG: hypothetical protein Q4P66_07970 [Actinomycetaceae bacterium]|nr:hypothetical protein [Actinomycetaceae bacterium]
MARSSSEKNAQQVERSTTAKVLWGVYGLILIAVLAGIVFYTYQVMTGKAYSYGHEPVNVSASTTTKTTTVPATADHPDYADTEQVKALTKLPALELSELGGDKNSVTFRHPSGSMVCTISTDLEKYPLSEWVPVWTSSDGKKPSGAGVSCGVVRPVEYTLGDAQTCAEGSPRGVAYGISDNNGKMAGACLSDRAPLNADAVNRTDKRMEVPKLGLGYRAEVGNYSCTFESLGVTCANVTNGKGFKIYDTSYEYFGLE